MASAVLGSIGPVPRPAGAELEAQGVPAQGPVGLEGVELALDARLRGSPGGELLAGSRVLAYASARAAARRAHTISPAVQGAAVTRSAASTVAS